MGTRSYDYQIVHQKSLKHSPGCWNLHQISRWTAERVENQGLRASRPITKYQIVHLFAYQSNIKSKICQIWYRIFRNYMYNLVYQFRQKKRGSLCEPCEQFLVRDFCAVKLDLNVLPVQRNVPGFIKGD